MMTEFNHILKVSILHNLVNRMEKEVGLRRDYYLHNNLMTGFIDVTLDLDDMLEAELNA